MQKQHMCLTKNRKSAFTSLNVHTLEVDRGQCCLVCYVLQSIFFRVLVNENLPKNWTALTDHTNRLVAIECAL